MIARRDASVMGMPIPGFGGVDAVTTEQDWVVTGSRSGQDFKVYVSPHVSRDEAILLSAALMATLRKMHMLA